MMTRRAALSRTRLAALLPLALAACEGTLDTGEPEAAPADDFKVEEKIVGGRLETGYPAVGALLTADGGLCSGTVIASRWVITAAHCLEGGVSGAVFALGNDVDSPSKVINVASGRQHPQYDADNIVNDIALVRLASDAGVAPVPMAQPCLDHAEGESAHVRGFRRDVGQRRIELGHRSARWSMPLARARRDDVHPTACAASNTCSGDSGGPAFMHAGRAGGSGGRRDVLRRCELPTAYGVDTRVDVYGGVDRSRSSARRAPPRSPSPRPRRTPAAVSPTSANARAPWRGGARTARSNRTTALVHSRPAGTSTTRSGTTARRRHPRRFNRPRRPQPRTAAVTWTTSVNAAGRVAQWCEGGRLVERNCASFGQACGYVNASVGYYCR
jgi:hypothetical protein